jgi:adenylate cyclase
MRLSDISGRIRSDLTSIIIPLLCVIIAGFIAWTGCQTAIGQLMELRSQDLRFKIRGSYKPDEEIVIIKVDEKTFDRLKLKYPFPPKLFAGLIKNLTDSGASVIAFDFLYSEPSRECDPPGQDAMVAETAKTSSNVVWAMQLGDDDQPKFPIDIIKQSVSGYGFINMPDERDGRIRRTFTSRTGIDSFAAAVVKGYAGFIPENWRTDAPLSINFRGPAGTYRSYSFCDVIQGGFAHDEFKGKICLVGATFAASHDIYPTVFHSPDQPDTPGVEIHANIIGNILKGDFLKPAPSFITWLFVMLLMIVIETAVYLDHPWLALLIWILALTGWFSWSLYRFFLHEVVLLFAPLAVISASFWTSFFFSYLKERQKKKEIKELFSSYIDPSVVSWLLKNPEAVKFEGDRKNVTVLYTDIEGFTAITESMDPVKLVRQLNIYFETLTSIGIAEGGMHDKFVGDAVMMIFGFPKYEDNHALKAVMAAKQMLESIGRLNSEWVRTGITPLKTRIGICSGEVVIGNVGGMKRKAFTAMGDAPNLASRLEGLNKRYGTHVLISESTAKLLPKTIPLRDLGEIQIRGYSKMVRVLNPSFDVPPVIHEEE